MTVPVTRTTSSADLAATSTVLGQQPDRGAADASVPALDEQPAPEVPSAPAVATYLADDGRVHYASPHAKATQDRVAAGEWQEHELTDEGPFNPVGKLVREVTAHLEQHADEAPEVARVKLAEAEGEDRPTIRDWAPGA